MYCPRSRTIGERLDELLRCHAPRHWRVAGRRADLFAILRRLAAKAPIPEQGYGVVEPLELRQGRGRRGSELRAVGVGCVQHRLLLLGQRDAGVWIAGIGPSAGVRGSARVALGRRLAPRVREGVALVLAFPVDRTRHRRRGDRRDQASKQTHPVERSRRRTRPVPRATAKETSAKAQNEPEMRIDEPSAWTPTWPPPEDDAALRTNQTPAPVAAMPPSIAMVETRPALRPARSASTPT